MAPTGLLFKRLRQTSWSAASVKHCDDHGIMAAQRLYARSDAIAAGACAARIKPAKRQGAVRLLPRHGGDDADGDGVADSQQDDEEGGEGAESGEGRRTAERYVSAEKPKRVEREQLMDDDEDAEEGTGTFQDEAYRKVGARRLDM
jgi:hypothetical protein